jgi:hypothetical protein
MNFRKYIHIHLIWFVIPAIALVLEIAGGPQRINNYHIFKNVFWHTLHLKDLYAHYPSEYFDKNHYGILFSLLIMPFAMLPDWLGAFLWGMANVSILYLAIRKLPLNKRSQKIVLIITFIEMLTSIQNVQFNPMLCSILILALLAVRKNKLGLATFLIIIGTFTKLYGIVGLAFLLFPGSYLKSAGYLLLWSAILFCLPMILSNTEFVWNAYIGWKNVLLEKNGENTMSSISAGMQDISVMGIFKRISGYHSISYIYFLIPAAIFTLLPLCRYNLYKNTRFQLTLLAQLLIGLVIFSSSAESPTYVIAVTGYSIWFVGYGIHPPKWQYILLALMFILTILSPTDLFPRILREQYVIRYALKALPCLIAWLIITFQLVFSNFERDLSQNETN